MSTKTCTYYQYNQPLKHTIAITNRYYTSIVLRLTRPKS